MTKSLGEVIRERFDRFFIGPLNDPCCLGHQQIDCRNRDRGATPQRVMPPLERSALL
jgi:hypothetical protein